jgi:hypothetical protein
LTGERRKKIMKVIFNRTLDFEPETEQIWSAQNGATRRTLVLISTLRLEAKDVQGVFARVGWLDKGNHSFIFLNPEKSQSKRIVGLYLCSGYGYVVIRGKELYTASSVGGYGNSESRFGLYEPGTIIAESSYKNRQGRDYYRLTAEKWEFLGTDVAIDDDEVTMLPDEEE